MLNLGRLGDLARALGVELSFLHEVLDDFDSAPGELVDELTLWPADQTKKPRDVICIRKRWRLIQERIYLKLLLPWFRPSRCSHGGVKRRSPATNARMHRGNTHAFVADISNFFPSIRCGRVNKLFLSKACHYKVANALTRLCTHEFHLALGLITSPIIANELLRPIDEEIERFCQRHGLKYSRFIDDLTISGKFDLKKCHVEEALERALLRHHFKIARKKSAYGRLDVAPARERRGKEQEQLAITGVRLKRHHIDLSRNFIQELERIMADHLSLANNGPFAGPLYLQDEVFGKAYYACSINPGRRRTILGRLKEIDWSKLMTNAVDRELVRFVKRLKPRGEPRPDCSERLALSAGAKYVREYYEQNAHDPSEAPFDVPGETVTTEETVVK